VILTSPPPLSALKLRQGWGCECTFLLASPDLGFARPYVSLTPLLRVPGFPYPELPPNSIFILPMSFPHYFTPLHADLTSSSLASLLQRTRCHSKLPSPWRTSFPLPSWIWRSLRSPHLCAKYEHRTVSCAFSTNIELCLAHSVIRRRGRS
jgi:hypothetical protein